MKYPLTIITINYNNDEGLKATFDSVIKQSFQDFEYIVIDGDSSDKSLEYIKNNKRINLWISEKDKGIYNAMNKGIDNSNGKYILFLNSGDEFHSPNVLTNISPHFKNNIQFLYGNAFFKNEKEKYYISYPKKLNFSFFYSTSLCHQSTFYNKNLFQNQKYSEDYKIISDWAFNTLNICKYNVSYLHLDEIICNYKLDGVSHTNKNLDAEERNHFLNKEFKPYVEDYNQIIGLLTVDQNKAITTKTKEKLFQSKKITKEKYFISLPVKLDRVRKKRLIQFIKLCNKNILFYLYIKLLLNISSLGKSLKKL